MRQALLSRQDDKADYTQNFDIVGRGNSRIFSESKIKGILGFRSK